MKQMFKYYEVVSNCKTVLYGSYDQDEAKFELEAMRDSYKEDGYKGVKLRWKAVDEAPDVGIYGKAFKPKMTKVLAGWQLPKVSANVEQIQRQLGASLLPW
jgi:hypothetical protein